MPIYAPGKRDPKYKGQLAAARRSANASLSLTPMVDMFTIMVVFLLMNYKSTGEVIHIPKEVQLPKASQTKELKPAHVVTVTPQDLILDKDFIAKVSDVKASNDWLIPKLREKLAAALKKDDEDYKRAQALKNAIPVSGRAGPAPTPDEKNRKLTVQADKEMDFLTIKKVMYTVTEAGTAEINFAVTKEERKENPTP